MTSAHDHLKALAFARGFAEAPLHIIPPDAARFCPGDICLRLTHTDQGIQVQRHIHPWVLTTPIPYGQEGVLGVVSMQAWEDRVTRRFTQFVGGSFDRSDLALLMTALLSTQGKGFVPDRLGFAPTPSQPSPPGAPLYPYHIPLHLAWEARRRAQVHWSDTRPRAVALARDYQEPA